MTTSETTPLHLTSTLVKLQELTSNPYRYDFFTFRPDVEKLILAGDADGQHICILWYTAAGGGVNRHYHAMTEAVYVINGRQTDAKGTYAEGTLYCNPPGSSHAISDSSGFFLLAYAAPPVFSGPERPQPYAPVRVETTAANLSELYPFTAQAGGAWTHSLPLPAPGGIRCQLIKPGPGTYPYAGNYLLVLKGTCSINQTALASNTLVVAKTIAPQLYQIRAQGDSASLVLALGFSEHDPGVS